MTEDEMAGWHHYGCSSPVSAIPSPSWISSCLKGFLPRRPTGSHRLHQVATERFSLRTSGRTQPCWHSDCRHLPPELRENQLLLFGESVLYSCQIMWPKRPHWIPILPHQPPSVVHPTLRGLSLDARRVFWVS